MSNLLSRPIIFCLCLLFSFVNISAQVENQPINNFKNTIGGSFSINSAQNNRNLIIIQGNLFDNLTRSNSVNFSPYYLRTVKPNLRIGLIVNYTYSTFEAVSPGIVSTVFTFPLNVSEFDQKNFSFTTSRNIGAWIFARSKIKQFNKFHIFIEPMIGIENSNIDTEGINWILPGSGTEFTEQSTRNERINNLLNIRVNFGIAYALSQRWNLISRLGNLTFSSGTTEEYYSVSTAESFFSMFRKQTFLNSM